MINAGLGGGFGCEKTNLGERSCVGFGEGVAGIGFCQLAAAYLQSSKDIFSFTEMEEQKNNGHFSFLCFGGTCSNRKELTLREAAITPGFSSAKCGWGKFFSLSPKILDTQLFQQNLGLRQETCNEDIGDYAELIANVRTRKDLDLCVKGIIAAIKASK